MTKKFLIGAVLAAAVLSISCQKEIGDINWKKGVVGSGDGTTTFTVKQTNETDHVLRGMKQVGALGRAQGTCIITINDQKSTTQDGVAGFATCFTKNNNPGAENDGTYNFLVVGVRNSYGYPQTYVSYYCNISGDNLSAKNFGAGSNSKPSFDANETKPYEIIIIDLPDERERNIPTVSVTDGTLKLAVKFTGKDNGDIDIEWLNNVVLNTQASTVTSADSVKTETVPGTQIGRDATSKNGKLCTYANIYKGKSFNARWDICDISWATESSLSADDDFIEVGDVIFE
ncbi:MAG: hypothetical protein J6X78_03250 [Treponema sp.]|nr:hypothetical protein [Treponema sp.]